MSLSRRQFIKTAGIATIGATLPGTSMLGSKAMWSSNSNTLKVGLIGCGGRGTAAAGEALNADPNVIITAMADAFDDRLQESYNKLKEKYKDKVQVSKENQFVGLDAYQKLIDTDVDVVLLVAPTAFRPDHLEAAVKANKHVFAEKPFAVDAPGIRRVMKTVEEAKKKNLSLVSGFCWRYHYPKRQVFKKVLDGQIGNILTADAFNNTTELWYKERQKGWTDMEYQLRNWLYYNWLSGDHIVEQAIHSIDMLQWAMSDIAPISVVGSGGRQKRTDPKFGNIYDHFALTYTYPSGAKAYFSCRQQNNTSPSYGLELVGSDGDLIVNNRTGVHEIKGRRPYKYEDATKFTDDKSYENKEVSRGMYQQEHDELFASIRSGKPINDGEWMTRSNLVAIAGRMAAYTGQTILIEDALASEEVLFPRNLSWNTKHDIPIAIPGITEFK